MNTININSKIDFSELIEIIKSLPLKEKTKIKELVFESTYEVPDWQKKIVMERSEEYLANPSIGLDFEKAMKEIEDEL